MKFCSIASSSSGNTNVVTSEDGSTSILIDAGVTHKATKVGLDKLGIAKIDAIFITHSHSDHIQGVAVNQRKFGCPIYMHELTYEEIDEEKRDNISEKPLMLKSGEPNKVGTLTIVDFSTNHDVYSCGFYVTEEGTNKSLAYFTDTGSTTALMKAYAEKASSVFIEADYDVVGLAEYDEYPDFLKDRIKNDFGHLSTQQMIVFLKSLKNLNSLNKIFVGHISERTNSPELVLKHVKEEMPEQLNKIVLAPFEVFHYI